MAALSSVLVVSPSRHLVKCHTCHARSALMPAVCAFSTNLDSFYTSSSVRSQRRKRRRLALLEQTSKQRDNANALSADDNEYHDTRTIKDILFMTPDYGDDGMPSKKQYPKTLSGWMDGFRQGWVAYKGTWEGFFSSKGFIVEHKEKSGDIALDSMQTKTDRIKDNVKDNAQFLAQESDALRTKITEKTGISTKEDLRRFAAEMMRLAADCVKEFMSGYRKGRDDEVEKMLTKYFQEMETVANKPRRRKIKRRELKHTRKVLR